MNPDVRIFDDEAQEGGEMIVRHRLASAQSRGLPVEELDRILARDPVVESSHSLEKRIGRQLRAGSVLTDMLEDRDHGPPDERRCKFMPPLLATRTSKPNSV